METTRVITSFTSHTTAEGKRLSYTYSVVDANGNVIKDMEKATCIVVNPDILQNIENINKFLLNREGATV